MLQQATGFSWQFLVHQVERLKDLLDYVVTRRVGKNGPRPFGSNRKLSKYRTGLGARIRTDTRGSEPTRQQPLQGVFFRLRQWFHRERAYDQEVDEASDRAPARVGLPAGVEPAAEPEVQLEGSPGLRIATQAVPGSARCSARLDQGDGVSSNRSLGQESGHGHHRAQSFPEAEMSAELGYD